jgi:transposase
MNKLSNEKRTQVIAALVEGNSMLAVSRMTGVAKNTVSKLLADIGEACAAYQDKVFRNLKCKRIQCDEIWTFCWQEAKASATRRTIHLWRWRRLHLGRDLR